MFWHPSTHWVLCWQKFYWNPKKTDDQERSSPDISGQVEQWLGHFAWPGWFLLLLPCWAPRNKVQLEQSWTQIHKGQESTVCSRVFRKTCLMTRMYPFTFLFLAFSFCKMKIPILKSIPTVAPSTSVKCRCNQNKYMLCQCAIKGLTVVLI